MDIRATVYQCKEDVVWVQDSQCIVVVSEKQGRSFLFTGMESAIWNWLSLGYNFDKISDFIAISKGIELVSACTLLVATLETWFDLGLLSREDRI